MATIPDASALGNATPKPALDIAQPNRLVYRPGGIGEEVSQLGRTVSRNEDEADQLQYATARSAFLQKKVALETQVQQDPNWQNAGTTYATGVKQAQADASSSLPAYLIPKFQAETGLDIATGAAQVSGYIKAKKTDKARGDLDNLLDTNRTAALSSPATAPALIQSTLGAINGAQANGDISDAEAVNLRQKWTQDYGKGYLALMAPGDAYRLLTGRATNAPLSAGTTIPGGNGGRGTASVPAYDPKRLEGLVNLSGGRTGNAANLIGINPEFGGRLQAMLTEYNQTTGAKPQLNSGTRTSADQEWMLTHGTAPAAAPGTSPHEAGIAVDLNSSDVAKMDKLGLFQKYGLEHLGGSEFHHVQLAGGSSGGSSTPSTPGDDPVVPRTGTPADFIPPDERALLAREYYRQARPEAVATEANAAADNVFARIDSAYIAAKGSPQPGAAYVSKVDYIRSNYADILAKVDADTAAAHPTDPEIQQLVHSRVEQKLNDAIRQQQLSYDADNHLVSTAASGTMTNGRLPTSVDALRATSSEVAAAWDRMLVDSPTAAMNIQTKLMTANSHGAALGYGSQFYDLYQRATAPTTDPNRLSDSSKLYGLIHPEAGENSPLTNTGLAALKNLIDRRRTPEGDAIATAERNFFQQIRPQLTGSNAATGTNDPKGDERFNKFMIAALARIQGDMSAGIKPQQLFDPKSPEYVGKLAAGFQRSTSQAVADMIAAQSANVPLNFGGGQAIDISTPDGLKAAVAAGRMQRAAAEEIAAKNGWIAPRPPSVPTPH